MRMLNVYQDGLNMRRRRKRLKSQIVAFGFLALAVFSLSFFIGHALADHFRSIDRAAISQECGN